MIGSRQWLEGARKDWEAQSSYDFDAVRAFRRDTLREMSAQRPRRWWGGLPWKLNAQSSLHPRFVRYLDVQLELHTWKERLHVAKHQSLQWWADRLDSLETMC